MNPKQRDTGPRGDRPAEVLDVVEFLYESGAVRFRVSRYMSIDGTKWVRHGPFVAYHQNGHVATKGRFSNGLEVGVWQDYHENGRLAANGMYGRGKEIGYWNFWDQDGVNEEEAEYDDGVEIGRWPVRPARPEGATENSQGWSAAEPLDSEW